MNLTLCRFTNRYGSMLFCMAFAFTIVLQCALFHYLAFHSVQILTIFREPARFWQFYLPKVSISLIIASISLLTKKKTWSIICSILISIWILAELIYFRINGIFIDAVSLTIVSNMNGFWNGIFAFVYQKDLLLIIPTLLLAGFVYCFKSQNRSFYAFLLILLIAATLHMVGTILIRDSLEKGQWKDNDGQCRFVCNPFLERGQSSFWGFTDVDYAGRTSVVHCFLYDVFTLAQIPFKSDKYQMEEQDIEDAKCLFNTGMQENKVPSTRLYIILFESLETWTISPQVTPAIQNFLST